MSMIQDEETPPSRDMVRCIRVMGVWGHLGGEVVPDSLAGVARLCDDIDCTKGAAAKNSGSSSVCVGGGGGGGGGRHGTVPLCKAVFRKK